MNTGAIKTRYVPELDYTVGKATMPFNWNEGYHVPIVLKSKNQQQSSSCGGFATSYYKEVLNYIQNKTLKEISPKFIYSQSYVKGGGTSIYGLGNLLVKKGACSEETCPSYPATEQNLTRTSDITQEMLNEALNDKAIAYAQITDISIDNIASQLRDNGGLILGVTGQNNGTWLTKFPLSPVNNTNAWHHWVYACGAEMINGKKYIKIINSWGGIGEAGHQWLGEDYFKKDWIWCAWTLTEAPIVPAFKYTWKKVMKKGQSSTDIKALQKALKLEGLFPQEQSITGFYGQITQEAVKKFQQKYLPSQNNGVQCGLLTIAKLNELYGN